MRTVRDIIDGRAHGVFGVITKVKRGRLINDWFPTVLIRMSNPVGLPVCACDEPGPPHAWAEFAHVPCDDKTLDELFARLSFDLECSLKVEVVGDIVTTLANRPRFKLPVISGFVLAGELLRNMTVPNRDIAISEHCAVCPLLAGAL